MPRIRRVKQGRNKLTPPPGEARPPKAGSGAAGWVPVTMDVYRAPNLPPAAPDLQAAGRIREVYSAGRDLDQGGTGNVPSHVIAVGLTVDVRDGDMEIGQPGDKVYIPDKDGTQFEVYAVVRRGGERWCYCRRRQRVAGPFTPY